MSCPDHVLSALKSLQRCSSNEGVTLVDTHCLYPGDAVVRVAVVGDGKEYRVHDNTGAADTIANRGLKPQNLNRLLASFAGQRGLLIEEGRIVSQAVSVDELPIAILMVANASKDAATWALDHLKSKSRAAFRDMIDVLLTDRFKSEHKKRYLVKGKSGRSYHFDHAVVRENGKLILIDPVVPDAASVNASFASNIDVSGLDDPKIAQRIVFDEHDDWTKDSLRFLTLAAPPVPISSLSGVMDRIAA